MSLLFWVLVDSSKFMVLVVVVGCGFVVGGGLGGDIEWVVSSGGHKGVGLLFLLGEEKHTQRKRER